jgi:hypothetical protein
MALTSEFKLSPQLWQGGCFPSADDYRRILRRGRLHFSCDHDGFGTSGVGLAIDERPCNLLYHTSMSGYNRISEWGFKGPGRNEWLLEFVEQEREYIAQMHSVGIPVIVYQNENNLDMAAFTPEEIGSMDAELDPFSWAFSNPGRRFACVNKPGWRSYVLDRLRIRVGEVGADGVFLDNNTAFIHCQCACCKKLYADWCGGDLVEDMGRQDTVVADMRVFDYVGGKQIPRKIPPLADPKRLRYLEWRIERQIAFYRETRDSLESLIGRKVIFTANGHIAIAEQTAVQLSYVLDIHFSEDGYTSPPVSNSFNVRLGTSLGEGVRSHYTLTRTMESRPVPDMVRVLAAEGRAMGGSGEYWDLVHREDDRLASAIKQMREFFIRYADDVFAVEQDANDVAVVYSWRSDLWSSQPVSPARYASDLLEDINEPYDVLLAERTADAGKLGNYRLLIVPGVEIMQRVWFEAIQRFIDNGGHVISTGPTAALDENLAVRDEMWTGETYQRFEERVEKDYSLSRKAPSIHTVYRRPEGPWVEAVDRALGLRPVEVVPPTGLLSVNHTRLPDGSEAVHVVNRFVNVFPSVDAMPREGLALRVRRGKAVARATWLTPTGPEQELTVENDADGSLVALPPFAIYGIARMEF